MADETTTPDDEDLETGATETPESTEKPSESTSAPEKTPTALDALNEGIEEGQTPRRITPKSEETDEEKAAAGRPRNPDGTFKSETEEERAAREEAERLAKETPEEKAAREKKEAEDAKKADPINDPIPENLNKRTAERIKSLVETVRAQNALAEQHTQLMSAITSTGATPDEFAAMVNYMRAVHSDDPRVLEQAYTMLQGELRGLSIKIGKPLDEVNLLADPTNADLVQDVQGGVLTVQRAQEIALFRAQKATQTARTTQQTEATRTAQENEAARVNAVRELDALDADLRQRDGDAVFQAKYDLLVPPLKRLFARLDPKEWKGVFLEHYENTALPPALLAPPAPETTQERQRPLRPTTPAGGGAPREAPKSALDALSQALEGL
ncbi:MAG: hypothetical protein KGL39_14715 [Patescibacteria group bacterium]|nr:hypothetical protein [Patescibacteria group bacterium]